MDKSQETAAKSAPGSREARLASALRDNLKRRKAGAAEPARREAKDPA